MIQSKPSVLLVDDVELNLIALEAQLSKMNCDLVRANSGNEALRQLLKREFAIVLLDVQMPEMDGYEVAKYIREQPATRDLPIVFVTAMHPTEDNTLHGYSAGAVDFLYKPINPEVLRSKVQIFLDLYLNRRRLADEIEAHKKTLADLEAFNYSVSHDLRAPLRPLHGFSQALLDDYGDRLDDTAKNFLERIRAAAQRMGQLIDDMLQLSRLTRAQIQWQPVKLSEMAESIVAEIRKVDPDRQVQFVCEGEQFVQGDPRFLQIVLENLLRNAWKFTGKMPQATITFSIRQQGPEALCFVRDNGAGFDATYASKLFKPFQRLHAMQEFEGTGVGLAITERIIRHHRGRIWAEGALNQGATIYFTLPTNGSVTS